MTEFTCTVCGGTSRSDACTSCGAGVRDRAIIHVLSMELFGVALTIPEFPRIRSIRGLGLSDSHVYADRLAQKFDYRNTFYDREPRFDIAAAPPEEFGRYDFVISSEVFEHVQPPVDRAVENAYRLLKSNGMLVLTTPYSLEASTAEHYPELHEFGLAKVGDRLVLVNRTADGRTQVFDNPVFHVGCNGDALEMREFSECGLKSLLAHAGFGDVCIYSETSTEAWSLPMAARKGNFALSLDATREVMEHWQAINRDIQRIGGTYWFRLGHKLGLL